MSVGRRLVLLLLLLVSPAWAQFIETPLREDCLAPLGASWTQKIVPGHITTMISDGAIPECRRSITGVDGTDVGSVWWNPTTFGPDMSMSATWLDVSAPGANRSVVFHLRLQEPSAVSDTADSYQCRFEPEDDEVILRRLADGTGFTTLATCAFTSAVGDQFGCQIVGSTLSSWKNTGSGWTQTCSVTNTVIAGVGYAGWQSNSPAITILNLHFGTVGAAEVVSQGAIMPLLQ